MAKKSKPGMMKKGMGGSMPMKSGPNMMPHTGKKDCRCPNCKDKRK